MRIAIASLCEDARIREDGRLDLIGVAPDIVLVPSFPWRGRLVVGLVLEVAPGDDLGGTGMNVSLVRSDDGAVVGTVDPASAAQSREVPTEVDGPVHLHFRLELVVDTPREGNHRVLVRAPNGEPLADVAVALQVRP